MTGSFRTTPSSGFGPGQAADAMWQAFDQLKSGFDKRVGTRMGRGDVRASVLYLLAQQPMHGYHLIREIEERTGGRWKPSAGSVYPTLQLLADEGLVTVETLEDRKVYSLTEAGREAAEHVAASVPWDTADASDHARFGALPKAGLDLAQAVAQVARAGSHVQQQEAVEVLNSARRSLYAILSQD